MGLSRRIGRGVQQGACPPEPWPATAADAPGALPGPILPERFLAEPILPDRILIVSDAWVPQINGVVRSCQNIVAGLRAAGCAVEVIGPADFACVALPGYREIPIALAPGRRLTAAIERFAPQAVHIAVEGPLGWAARRHCLRRGIAFSTTFHTNFPAYVALRSPAPLAGPVERATVAVTRRFHAPAAFTYVATASIEAQLRRWGFSGRLVRLTHGVDCALFRPGPERPAGGPPVLLYVGRLAPEKNIEAFLRLGTEEIGPTRKVVVGDGPLLAGLRRRWPEVEFTGTLTGEALAAAYRAADCFVFPSRTDTFGLVLIEAMASGLPVAALDAPGPRDVIAGDARLGAVDDDLGRAVLRALAAPGSRQTRHRIARETYSWAAVAARFRLGCAELAA
jgi:glycosyltransferase involved in cell wall biosynthesis